MGFRNRISVGLKQVTGPLADEFRLVTFDLRGHGGSEKPLGPHYYREAERWAGEVEAVIRETGLEQPVLVAWSYAGRIVLDYLQCRGAGALGGVVFVGATSKMDASVVGPAAALMRPMTQAGLEANLAANLEATRAFLSACTAEPLPAQDLEFMLAFNILVPASVRLNMSARAADYAAVLSSISVPVLVLHGAQDRVCLPSMAAYTSAAVKHGRSIVYPGVGHLPFWEAPERFDADLADFLRRLER